MPIVGFLDLPPLPLFQVALLKLAIDRNNTASPAYLFVARSVSEGHGRLTLNEL